MDIEKKTCLVCHEVIDIFAIGTCDHPICLKCSTRLRQLCEVFYCPSCRTELNEVVFVRQFAKWEEIHVSRKNYIPNHKLKVLFEDDQIKKKHDELLEHKCSVCKDRAAERSFTALRDHMRRQHTLFYCDLCVEHLNIFTFERKTYNRQELGTHRRLGDADDTSYRGHPLCQFCEERYMDNDELLRHLRKDHFYCHFCDHESSNEYYCDYDNLKEHFRSKHQLCEEDECLTARFTHAFRSLIDLKAHKASCHKMSKAESRLARAVDIDIQFAPRGRGRGRGGAARDDDSYMPTAGRGRQRYGNFREAEDVDRAIQASLMTMKEDDTAVKTVKVPEKTKEAPKPVVPSPVILQDEENFPTLSGTPFPGPSSHNAEHTGASYSTGAESVVPMAKRVAFTNKMSVQHGQLGLKEFPSLKQYVSNYAKSSLSEEYKAPVKSVEPPKANISKEPAKQGVNTNRSFGRRPVSGYRESEDDFPELPPSITMGGGRSGSTSSTWANQSQPVSKNMMTVSETEFGDLRSNEKSNKKFDGVKPSLASLSKALSDDSEFPSLGGRSSVSAHPSWGKKGSGNTKSDKSSNISTPVSKGRTSPFKFEDLKWNSDEDFPVPKATEVPNDKNKTKKKKKKQVKPDSKPSIILPEKKENASLDIIASMLLHDGSEKLQGEKVKSIQEVEQYPEMEFVKVQSSKKDKRKVADKTKTGVSPASGHNIMGSLDSKNSSASKPPSDKKYPVAKKPEISEVENSPSERPVISVLPKRESPVMLTGKQTLEDDFPVLGNVAARSSRAKSKSTVVEKHQMKDDDFPILGAISATGSVQSNKRSPLVDQTPEFQDDFPALGIESVVAPIKARNTNRMEKSRLNKEDDFPALPASSVAGVKAPPGFGRVALSDNTSPTSPPPGFTQPNKQKLDSVKFDLKTLLPVASDTPNFLYVQPVNFQSRNQQLIKDIREILMNEEDKFNMFKEYAGDFRHGRTQAPAYYDNCKDLLGSDKFEAVFPELLVLLPDIDKQQELLTAHNKSRHAKKEEDVLHINSRSKSSPWADSGSSFVSCSVCQQVLTGQDYQVHVSDHGGDNYPALPTQTSSHSMARMGAWVKAK